MVLKTEKYSSLNGVNATVKKSHTTLNRNSQTFARNISKLANQTKTDLIFNIVSLAVYTFPQTMLESLDPCGIGALILVPENSSTAAVTSSSDQ